MSNSEQLYQDNRDKSILNPLLYADIFDYPLTFNEIHKYLEFKATPERVADLLAQAVTRREIILVDGFYSLAGKPDLAAIRRTREQASQQLWPKATRYGRWIASLPFVSMVSITGSLAVNNPRDNVDDIDYFIVTKPNRLWLCRALIILLVRLGRRRGIHLCPNYLLTENIIIFKDRNLYIARELVQMIPLYGKALYTKMRRQNSWVIDFLPQGDTLNLGQVDDRLSVGQKIVKALGELVFSGAIGNLAEKILQKRQITKHLKLAEKYGALDKVTFTADECKGHYDGHGRKTLDAYRKRLNGHQVCQ